MEQARKLVAFAYAGIEAIKAPDDLRAALDSCLPLTKREEMICLLFAQSLPALLRFGLRWQQRGPLLIYQYWESAGRLRVRDYRRVRR